MNLAIEGNIDDEDDAVVWVVRDQVVTKEKASLVDIIEMLVVEKEIDAQTEGADDFHDNQSARLKSPMLFQGEM